MRYWWILQIAISRGATVTVIVRLLVLACLNFNTLLIQSSLQPLSILIAGPGNSISIFPVCLYCFSFRVGSFAHFALEFRFVDMFQRNYAASIAKTYICARTGL